jgi:hypothetical protein
MTTGGRIPVIPNTGHAPFEGKGIAATLRAVAEHHPPLPHALNPRVPHALSDLILRHLAKSPADRTASAEDLARELAALNAEGAMAATPRRWSRRVVVAAFGAILLAAAGVGVWARHRQAPPAGPPEPDSHAPVAAQNPNRRIDEPVVATDPQRRLAEMVLAGGGQVGILDRKMFKVIRSIQALPERFELTSVAFEGFREPVTDDLLDGLLAFDRLDALYLHGCTRVTDAGLERVRSQSHLRLLWLQNTQVTDSGLERLSVLTHLRELNLDGCSQVTDDWLEHLKGFKELKKLSLIGTRVTFSGVARLKQSLPQCEVTLRMPE